MGELSVNKRIGQPLALLDTCSYEALFKKGRTQNNIEICLSIISGKRMGIVSDLSFVELVEGRRNLKEFNIFREQFLSLGFGVFGHSDILSAIGSDALQNSFKTEQDYQLFVSVNKPHIDF